MNPERALKRKSPGYAGFLSIVYPGLGHIYLGCYKKGVLLMLIWAILIPLCFIGIGWVLASPFGAYCAIDAYNKAQKTGKAISSTEVNHQNA